MSKSTSRRLSLAIAGLAVATIAACSQTTAPTAPLELTKGTPAALDSGEHCSNGWYLVQGEIVCIEW